MSCFVYLSVASVTDEQTCLLENWQSVYHISGLVSLGQVCTQALCHLITLEALQLCPWTPRLIAAAWLPPVRCKQHFFLSSSVVWELWQTTCKACSASKCQPWRLRVKPHRGVWCSTDSCAQSSFSGDIFTKPAHLEIPCRPVFPPQMAFVAEAAETKPSGLCLKVAPKICTASVQVLTIY